MKPLPPMARALRPKQWTKNAVVLAAFIFALGDRSQAVGAAHLLMSVGAVLLFCAVSSGIYLLNDIRDRALDRAHPTKRFRPIAAGELTPRTAVRTAIGLLAGGLLLSLPLSARLTGVLALYILLQLAYNAWLKNVELVDLFVIAGGFVLRALAGAVTIDVHISPWLLLCTLLLALFLALCKRRHEKVVLNDTAAKSRPALMRYNERLLDTLIAMIGAATLICYALYTLWPDTIRKFGTARLGLTIPFVIFGLFRYLDLAYRHDKGDRPEQILLTDAPLLINLFLYGIVVFAVLLLH